MSVDILVVDTAATPEEWDKFAGRCNGSYRCLYHAVPCLYLNHVLFARARRFDIYAVEGGRRDKIGQCSVVKGVYLTMFADQIQLLPEQKHRWSDIMRLILIKLGPGRYAYGSEWMLEEPRDAELRGLELVKISRTQNFFLEAIEFSRWPTWEDYERAVSRNAIRNARKFAHRFAVAMPGIVPQARIYALAHRILSMKSDSLARKFVIRSRMVNGLKSAVRLACLVRAARLYVSEAGKTLVSYALAVEVGANAFYLEGASDRGAAGAGWFVLLGAVRDAFLRSHGAGVFVMGPVSPETLHQPQWLGLQRSREQCRVTRRPVTTIQFQYGQGARSKVGLGGGIRQIARTNPRLFGAKMKKRILSIIFNRANTI